MQVFLSYAPADKNFASRLARHLEHAGFSIWSVDRKVFPGDNWAKEIGRALESSQAMVVLLSPASAADPTVVRDVQFAIGSLDYEQRVIPVMVRPTQKYPWILERFDIIKVGPDPRTAYRHVLRRLEAASATVS